MTMTGRVPARIAAVGMLVVVATGPASTQQAPQQPLIFQIDTDVIRVPTIVLDRRGRFVSGLKKEDFELLENGALQELTSFRHDKDAPIRAELLLDVSGSMSSSIGELKRAASQFIRHVGPKDLIRLVQFDEDVKPLIDFSNDRARLEAAIKSLVCTGKLTALHNALNDSLVALEAQTEADKAEERHRAIVVLTDGDDTSSMLTADEVLFKARRVETLIYGLSLERRNGLPVRDGPSSLLLRQLADLSGGDLQFPELTDLNDRFRDLAEQLRQQYMLGYVSSNTSGRAGWRTISLNVKKRTNLNLRYRQGYQARGR